MHLPCRAEPVTPVLGLNKSKSHWIPAFAGMTSKRQQHNKKAPAEAGDFCVTRGQGHRLIQNVTLQLLM